MEGNPVKVKRGDRVLELVPLKTWQLRNNVRVGLFQDPESGKRFVGRILE